MVNTAPRNSLGVIHILRNHQGGGGFRNDYANVIFALSNAEFDYGRGRGSRKRQKVITLYVNGPSCPGGLMPGKGFDRTPIHGQKNSITSKNGHIQFVFVRQRALLNS